MTTSDQTHMLWRADAGLVERDPAIPGLRTALHADALHDALRRIVPECRIEKLVPFYVRYKLGTSCLVGYHAWPGAGMQPTFLYARAHARSVDDKLAKAELREAMVGSLNVGVCIDASLGLTVHEFPNDHELRAMRRLCEDESRASLIRKMLPKRLDLESGAIEVLRYKPERRLVLRVHNSGGEQGVLRFYANAEYDAALANAVAMKSQSTINVARFKRHHDERRVLSFRWCEGTPLRDVIKRADAGEPVAAAVGCSLAGIHGLHLSLPGRLARGDFLASIDHATSAVSAILPAVAESAHRAAVGVASLLPTDWRNEVIHGDFSSEQILVDGDRIVVLDFDRAAISDGRVDVGMCVARQELECVSSATSAQAAVEFRNKFLDAYARRHMEHQSSLEGWRAFVAGALLRLAVEPFRSRHPDWQALTTRIVARAEEWCDGRE